MVSMTLCEFLVSFIMHRRSGGFCDSTSPRCFRIIDGNCEVVLFIPRLGVVGAANVCAVDGKGKETLNKEAS